MQRNNITATVLARERTAISVSATEWRWVTIFSGLLVAASVLPYLWAFISLNTQPNHRFVGILHSPLDSAVYIAKIEQGIRGAWLSTLTHTPEAVPSLFLNSFYLALGHLASALGLSALMIFHLARLTMSFAMFVAFYHLGSAIWQRLRPRRLFFSILAVGSGLGWLALILSPQTPQTQLAVDLNLFEAIPLLAIFANAHFPLAITLIALIAATYVTVFRPGFEMAPTFLNGGLSIALISLLLVIVLPHGWLPIASALVLYLIILSVRMRRLPRLELTWVSLTILPAVPILIYYWALLTAENPLSAWVAQNRIAPLPPDRYLFGFGLPLIAALPAIWRAVRYFERDGDRFMLLWLIVNVIILYLPLPMPQRSVIGLFIPIVYFATRAIEDFWFERIPIKWRDAALVAFFVFSVPSNVLMAIVPMIGINDPVRGEEGGLMMPKGYTEAFRWLNNVGEPGAVVLAHPLPSLWLPAYTALRVVYGHPYDTLEGSKRSNEVQQWYAGQNCRELIARYDVRYILTQRNTPYEGTICLNELGLRTPAAVYNDVSVYRVPRELGRDSP
ncbi:MAG: hypothetical protein CUN49_00740 [Candidatus Thermofonsia Clade 1 bacterium]|jgi:hypothetical protein|uniref:Glycosyltransferase RgtA/B/C/D-like domain-containing protein n=1 Tax=Candidatus Thermofonsia Clade 1 bacterium TaxID=2364210 RepID=A0A2M8PIJ1_9CHLR|nr:MAG: hypothetical protein CUN49_00740 [Candidatus Thermofonsia Clade 1 bacterium]RMF49853.1 MAG: hypothetical protein D6749_12130 [Chloroflexota bacterium]